MPERIAILRPDMPELDVPIERLRFGQTSRKDTWWLAAAALVDLLRDRLRVPGLDDLLADHYWVAALPHPAGLAAVLRRGPARHPRATASPPGGRRACRSSPALFIALFPAGFRLSCYYYRGAYYKALWARPARLRRRRAPPRVPGRAKPPLIVMNIHRYFLYFGIALVFFLTYDVILATRFPVAAGRQRDHLRHRPRAPCIMAANVVFVALYTFCCHSFRHLVGGVLDIFSRAPAAQEGLGLRHLHQPAPRPVGLVLALHHVLDRPLHPPVLGRA